MNKRNKTINQKNTINLSRKRIIILGILFTIGGLIIYGGINSLKTSNGIFISSPPRNIFLKAMFSQNTGYLFTSQSTGTAKSLNSGAGSKGGAFGHNPPITLKQGNSLSIHLINEDSVKHSKHNLNIDEFNVHTRDLGYFQSQTVTFSANKSGTFDYYCSIHPEMKGKVIVHT
ncbi:MAG: cupredoxin domain-containing protein [Nitrososphaerales archaeon]|jgi:plastocyanin